MRTRDPARAGGWHAVLRVLLAVSIVTAAEVVLHWEQQPGGINPEAKACAPVWREMKGVPTCQQATP
jgi:hypothetical protein